MSQYFKFTPTQNEFTTLRFTNKGIYDSLTIKEFDTHVIAIDGDQLEIDALISDQFIEIGFSAITFAEFLPLAMASSQGRFQLAQLDSNLSKKIDEINEHASDREIMTWGKQEQEARALVANADAVTPMIDGLVLSRGLGETRLELANKIIAQADNKAGLIADCLGEYQKRKRELFA